MKFAILVLDSNNFPDKIQKTNRLANQLNLPIVANVSNEYQAYFLVEACAIRLWIPSVATHPYCVDFASCAMQRRIRHWQKELLSRACGVKNKSLSDLQVLDATAGFGRDAFILAHAFSHVYLMEKNPFVFTLLIDGINRISDENLRKRLHPIAQNAIDFLQQTDLAIDIIYLDPMFEETKQRAKVKKDLQLLQAMCGKDKTDTNQLLHLALVKAKQRVIVKRAIHAPFLASVAPSYSLKGKDSRFDIYLNTCAK